MENGPVIWRYLRAVLAKSLRLSVHDGTGPLSVAAQLAAGIGGSIFGFSNMIHIDHLDDWQKVLLYFLSTVALAFIFRMLIWSPYEAYKGLDAENRALLANDDADTREGLETQKAHVAEMKRANDAKKFDESSEGQKAAAERIVVQTARVSSLTHRPTSAFSEREPK